MIEQKQSEYMFESRQFWCHHCQKQFLSSLRPGIDQVLCPNCESDFCQLFTVRSRPNNYEPYQKPLKPKNRKFFRYPTQAVLQALAQYAGDVAAQKVREISDEDLKNLKMRVGKNLQQCLICKQELKFGTEALKCPCEHVYHTQCLVEWLQYKNSCPKCRSKILDHCEE